MSTQAFTDQWGRTITPTDNGDGTTNWIADDGTQENFANSTDPAQIMNAFNDLFPASPTAAQAIKYQSQQLAAEITTYIHQTYTQDQLTQMFVIYFLAQQGGLNNRAAYLAPLFTWVQSVLQAGAAYMATINGMGNGQQIMGTSPNLSSAGNMPNVTFIGALSISN